MGLFGLSRKDYEGSSRLVISSNQVVLSFVSYQNVYRRASFKRNEEEVSYARS